MASTPRVPASATHPVACLSEPRALRRSGARAACSALLLGLAMAGPAGAAERGAADRWQFTLTPYIWASGMGGDVTVGTPVGPLPIDVDVGFSDILSNLKMGGMLAVEANRGSWVVMADVIYMRLGADRTRTAGPVTISGDAEVRQTGLELDVGYRVTERLVLFAGLRRNAIDTDLTLTVDGPPLGTTTRRAGPYENWVDPLVGARFNLPLGARWALVLRGDFGGFGFGSDQAIQGVASLRYAATERLTIDGGFRYLDINYSDGSGPTLFDYDVATTGPGLGFSWRL